MKKDKLVSYLVILGIVLGLPSIVYLFQRNGSLTGYNGEYFYIFDNQGLTKYGAIIYLWIVVLMFLIYIKLIKKSEQFKGIKDIMISATLVGIAFIIALPNTSKDAFFYMGNGRIIEKYRLNPYRVTAQDLETVGIKDKIIETVGSQKEYKCVYGPIFLTVCGLLNRISFSSISLFLYELKIVNLLMYLLTVYLVYKLTKKKKLTILYCFNPLLLLEILVNVHNDIFVLAFAFFGIYLAKEAEHIEDLLKSEWCFLLRIRLFITFNFN